MPPIVAIVGRPNVGKSTLFNRLVRRRQAITHDRPGVTRDRLEAPAELGGRLVTLIDTGGMDYEAEDGLARQIVDQAEIALTMADVVLFIVDGVTGRTALDDEMANRLRRIGKPVLVAVNKVDGLERVPAMTSDFHAWGFPLLPLSAAHGYGQPDLVEALADLLPEPTEEPRPEPTQPGLRLAVLGRPNAGKSSLVNALLGETRLIVNDEAGTTRDAVDVSIIRSGKRYLFVDTAGVRKRTRIIDGLERYSVAKALSSAKRANVAVVVIDATGGVGVQDKRLIAYLDKERTPFLVAVNKVDLVPQKDMHLAGSAVGLKCRIAASGVFDPRLAAVEGDFEFGVAGANRSGTDRLQGIFRGVIAAIIRLNIGTAGNGSDTQLTNGFPLFKLKFIGIGAVHNGLAGIGIDGDITFAVIDDIDIKQRSQIPNLRITLVVQAIWDV